MKSAPAHPTPQQTTQLKAWQEQMKTQGFDTVWNAVLTFLAAEKAGEALNEITTGYSEQHSDPNY